MTAALREAARLVRQGWCQGRLAETAHGAEVHPCSPEAARWCLVGAVVRATGNGDSYPVLDAVIAHLGFDRRGESLRDWNDAPGRTVDEVAAVLLGAVG